MSLTKFHWVKVAESEKEFVFHGNDIAEIKTEEKTICIGRYQGLLYAFAAKCPHASGFFIEGHIDALGNVVCPMHRYKFNLQNGRNVSGEGYFLKHWPVQVREDGVYVGFEKNKLFGLL